MLSKNMDVAFFSLSKVGASVLTQKDCADTHYLFKQFNSSSQTIKLKINDEFAEGQG